MTKITRYGLLVLIFLFSIPLNAEVIFPIGQTLQITTRFRCFEGLPTWLLIVRDITSGKVTPYLFDIRNNDNFWVAFTQGHVYQVTASTLQFTTHTILRNFCHLEDGCILKKSFFITLTGDLTPNRHTVSCHVMKYNDPLPYTIVR